MIRYVTFAGMVGGNVLIMRAETLALLAQLQAQDVAAIAELHLELIRLSSTMHASDPRLVDLTRALEARAAGVRGRFAEALNTVVGGQLAMLIPQEMWGMMEASSAHAAKAPRRTSESATLDAGTVKPATVDDQPTATTKDATGGDTDIAAPTRTDHGSTDPSSTREAGATAKAPERNTTVAAPQPDVAASGGTAPHANGAGTGGGTQGWKPAAEHQGLGGGRVMGGYQRALGRVESQWTSMSLPQRLQHLTGVINQSLHRVGVQEVAVVTAALAEGTHGQFAFDKWQLVINETVLLAPILTTQEFQGLGNTLYHEARHAEQWYQIAGYLALQGLEGKGIEQLTGMPPAVVPRAIKNASKMSKQQIADAKTYTENIYGHKLGRRSANLTFAENERSAQTALENDLRNKPLTQPEILMKMKQLQDSQQRLQVLHDVYRQFPEEVDAFRVGDRTALLNRSLTKRFGDYALNLVAAAKQWLAAYVSFGRGAGDKTDLVKAHSYLVDAMARIQQHLGTLGNTPIEQAERPWLTQQLVVLRTVQQSYQAHLAAQGTVVP